MGEDDRLRELELCGIVREHDQKTTISAAAQCLPPLLRASAFPSKVVSKMFSNIKELNYKTFFWGTFTIVSILAIFERFFASWMHDGQIALSKLEDNADQNNEGLLPFLIVVPLTARLIVISICLFFFTMCRVFHNKLVDWTSNIPGVDFSDAANVIYRGHKLYGLFFFTSILAIHIIFAFSPAMSSHRQIVITDEKFEPFYPAVFRRIEFTHFPGKWAMRRDDLWDASIALFVALVLQPITIIYAPLRVLYYNISFAMHIVGALVMIWLVYRIPEHIRIFTYATPFIVAWAVDRILHEFLFRNTASSVKFIDLDEDYTVMLFTIKHSCPVNIGDVYLLKTSMNVLEFSHPYTCFHYRAAGEDTAAALDIDAHTSAGPDSSSELDGVEEGAGLQVSHIGFKTDAVSLAGGKLAVAPARTLATEQSFITKVSSDTSKKDETYGCIVRKFGPKSFSQRLCNGLEGGGLRDAFYAIGPYRRIYRRLMRTPQPCPYVLIGTGSGCSFIMDFIYWLRSKKLTLLHPVYVHASTHSYAMLDFLSDTLLRHGNMKNLFVKVHITSHHLENPESFLVPVGSHPSKGSLGSKSMGMGWLFSTTPSIPEEPARPGTPGTPRGFMSFPSVSEFYSSEKSGESEGEWEGEAQTFTALSEINQEHRKRNLPAGGFGKRFSARGTAVSPLSSPSNRPKLPSIDETNSPSPSKLPSIEETRPPRIASAPASPRAAAGASRPMRTMTRGETRRFQEHVAVGLKRMDFDSVLAAAPAGSEVYFCGASPVMKILETKTKEYGLPLFHEESYV
eukprot:CAMPEP_0173220170 /NCGR_PEP_ID=MMETSP1142-20121109/2006_1 /TAXON_ID=483371 /ORGANISM="non described non described, Strain CCMP2298" /LENGTH=793 /DNA_ID=CAMNT_0014148039 /DNA_START=169 /DNA_END=2550 /DNA_ORIENTATION=-